MGWREQLGSVTLPDGRELIAGSFRGVVFRTVGGEARVGRRNVVNEFPGRDDAYAQDIGRKARRYPVEAYVIGANYLAERDLVMEAFEAKGPGELIHPRYGVRQVALEGDAVIKEPLEKGGMAIITATFVEHGENTFPHAVGNTISKVESTTNAADEATQTAFSDEFSVAGPSVLATQAIKKLNSSVAGVLKTAQQVTSVEGLTTIAGQAGGLSGNLANLVRTPIVLVQSLRSIYAALVQDVARPLTAFYELQWVFASNQRTAGTAMPGSTRARSLVNSMASADLQRRLALSNQARVLTVAIADTDVVTTSDQAKVLRDALVGQIDIELEAYDPPAAVASSLTQMRAAVVRDVAARAEFLMERSTYTPKAVLPALVLAHRIYQDSTRAEELVTRNGVRNPAFMPVRALEILR
ncbi:MAG: DNA circularization N-terminal domain-containing protein [Burkholderiaceae bacterium]|nr:DNA circularization N-terminal domain-containing protein [Burkholderiaceae bacterium]